MLLQWRTLKNLKLVPQLNSLQYFLFAHLIFFYHNNNSFILNAITNLLIVTCLIFHVRLQLISSTKKIDVLYLALVSLIYILFFIFYDQVYISFFIYNINWNISFLYLVYNLRKISVPIHVIKIFISQVSIHPPALSNSWLQKIHCLLFLKFTSLIFTFDPSKSFFSHFNFWDCIKLLQILITVQIL